eukprot:TRINITY_DN91185_c0_g1_i1.p1 TRINITY_DN91185_c0_g1~~TRINITY_DN91185_c0_g1_i1.p1  ORF type:complete len:522 (+),score=86.33 TRINITY_DN91185_c0_g1_i1:64-1629(+)
MVRVRVLFPHLLQQGDDASSNLARTREPAEHVNALRPQKRLIVPPEEREATANVASTIKEDVGQGTKLASPAKSKAPKRLKIHPGRAGSLCQQDQKGNSATLPSAGSSQNCLRAKEIIVAPSDAGNETSSLAATATEASAAPEKQPAEKLAPVAATAHLPGSLDAPPSVTATQAPIDAPVSACAKLGVHTASEMAPPGAPASAASAPASVPAATQESANQPNCASPSSTAADEPSAESLDQIVLTMGGLQITRRDTICLDAGNMLNDSVVDFFLRLIHEYLVPTANTYLYSSHFFTRLTAAGATTGEVGWQNVKGWTKKKPLYAQQLAIVPINSELHWWLCVIQLHSSNACSVPQPHVAWLDSLPGESSRYATVLQYVGGYLRKEWSERPALPDGAPMHGAAESLHKELDSSALKADATVLLPSPSQENGVDCGVFLLDNVLKLLTNKIDFSDVLGHPEDMMCAWCDQKQADQRRSVLRRTFHRLEAEARSAGCTVDVTDLFKLRPTLCSKLQVLWGISKT